MDLNGSKFVYSTLCEQSPELFSDWFIYTHDIHRHATKSSTTISQTHYFDIGTEHPTFSLYTPKSKLVNYGDKMIKVNGPRI